MKNTQEAINLLEQGINQAYIKNYEASIKSVVTAHNLFNEANDRDNSASCLCELALIYYHNYKSGPVKSISLLKEAQALIENNTNSPRIKAKIALYNGQILFMEKVFSESLKFYKMAQRYLINDKNCIESAQILDNLAVFHLRSGNFQMAVKFLKDSLKIKEQLGNNREIAITKLLLGRYLSSVENFEEAAFHLVSALKTIKDLNDFTGSARMEDELAKIYIHLGDYDNARKFSLESLETARTLNLPLLRAFSYCTLAHIEINVGNLESAQEILKLKVFPVFSELYSTRGYATAKRLESFIYNRLGNFKDALISMQESIELFKEAEVNSEIARCLYELGNIYRNNNDSFMAISSYELALMFSRSNNLIMLGKILEDVLFDIDEDKWAEVINKTAKKEDSYLQNKQLLKTYDLINGSPDSEKNLKSSLYSLLNIGRAIAVESNLDKLIEVIANETRKALRADRCTIYLFDKETNELYSKVALGLDSQEIRIPMSVGIAGHVASTGEVINIKDSYHDFRFNKEIDKKTGYKTKTVLCIPMRNMNHEIIGVIQVLNKYGENHFVKEDEDLLLSISSSAGVALENTRLFTRQQVIFQNQKRSFVSFINTLAASIDAKDKITSGHSRRVTCYSLAIAEQMKLTQDQIEVLEYAAMLHDFGKIGIKDDVLCKQGKLTNEEYCQIKEHAYITNEILKNMFFDEKFKDVPFIAATHHEKYDGTGYFQGLKGEEIPLGGRVIAVSDVFDALTSKRQYRDCMPFEEVLHILKSSSNTHFDGRIIDYFFDISLVKVLEILLSRAQKYLQEEDKIKFKNYKIKDIQFALSKAESERTKEELKLIDLFNALYLTSVNDSD